MWRSTCRKHIKHDILGVPRRFLHKFWHHVEVHVAFYINNHGYCVTRFIPGNAHAWGLSIHVLELLELFQIFNENFEFSVKIHKWVFESTVLSNHLPKQNETFPHCLHTCTWITWIILIFSGNFEFLVKLSNWNFMPPNLQFLISHLRRNTTKRSVQNSTPSPQLHPRGNKY
jgi:hypothetical protein